MKKYLVVSESSGGFAQLNNVAIIKANTSDDAVDIFCRDMRRSATGVSTICIDDLVRDYYYYN